MEEALPGRADIEYLAVPRVARVTPSFGAVEGGTLLDVAGRHFAPAGMTCEFGRAWSVPARVLSASRLRCVTPPSPEAQAVAVEVAVGRAVRSASGAEFSFEPAAMLLAVAPAQVLEGRGETLTLRGRHFSNVPALAVAFGSARTVGAVTKVVSSSIITAVAPPLAGVGNVSVEVSNNGYDFSRAASL